MAWYDIFKFSDQKEPEQITEATKSFKSKGNSQITKYDKNTSGEGVDDLMHVSFGRESAVGFNNFYNKFINVQFQNKRMKIQNYRMMAEMPEISSVIEDICIESTQEDVQGKILTLEITDDELEENDNIIKNIRDEFDSLFHKRLKIDRIAGDLIRTYYIDAEIYIEKIINKNKPSNGLINLKKLPTETMDYVVDPVSGKIVWYYQMLKSDGKQPKTLEEAELRDDIIVFFPEQIAHIDYGVYQGTKKNVIGYLEKCKQPFNQLKLLETAVIIYRIVKAPERLVFTIDTGAMPRDKAMAFVEKIKRNLTQKISYDPQKGTLENSPDIMSMLENYFLPQCLRMDTTIDCLDGKSKKLSQIIDEYNSGIKNEVYSVDQKTGEIIKGEVEWAGITRRNAELIRVHIDNGEYVDVTPDHKFVMRDGTEVEAQDLVSGDNLMPLDEYRKVLFIEKLDIKEDTGCLTIKDAGKNHNFALSCGVFVKNSSDGRGSNVSSIGGDPSGFAQLDDIYYFARKLYIALKYPISRVIQAEERRQADTMFMGGSTNDITIDEIRWAKFLEINQQKFCQMFTDMFLLHLEFKGLKKEYNLSYEMLNVVMTPPNDYKSQMAQMRLQTQVNNYTSLSNYSEFSKTFLMEKYLKWDMDEIKANSEGFKNDEKYLPKDEF